MSKVKYSEQITLQQEIKREGSDPIKQIKLRRPNAGELRGVLLGKIQAQDVGEVLKVASRVTEPLLTPEELNGLDPSDLTEVSLSLLDFFFSKEKQQQMAEGMMA